MGKQRKLNPKKFSFHFMNPYDLNIKIEYLDDIYVYVQKEFLGDRKPRWKRKLYIIYVKGNRKFIVRKLRAIKSERFKTKNDLKPVTFSYENQLALQIDTNKITNKKDVYEIRIIRAMPIFGELVYYCWHPKADTRIGSIGFLIAILGILISIYPSPWIEIYKILILTIDFIKNLILNI